MAGSRANLVGRTFKLGALQQNRALAFGLLLVLILAISLVNSDFFLRADFILRPQASFNWAWGLTILLLFAGIAVIGGAVNGRVEGVLIDNRNRISLSKLQMTLWSVLLISALVTSAAANIQHGGYSCTAAIQNAPNHGPCGALDISIPAELLLAAGIAATSFVAAPSLLSLKTQSQPSATAVQTAQEAFGLQANNISSSGSVFGFSSPNLASWSDLFLGDDVANAANADLGKVQQFGITALLIGVYVDQLWNLFSSIAVPSSPHFVARVSVSTAGDFVVDPAVMPVAALPILSAGFVTLLGISNAGYLAYKAAPHGDSTPISQSTPSSPDGAAG